MRWMDSELSDYLFMVALLSPWWVGAIYFGLCMARLAGLI